MKNKLAKIFTVLILTVCLTVALGGCDTSFYYKNSVTTDDGVVVYYNTHSDKAFVARCEWNGNPNDMSFTVPEEIEGCKVVRLGGYIGKGYPLPFAVSLPQEINGLQAVHNSSVPKEEQERQARDLSFTINLCKCVDELYYGTNDDSTVYAYSSEDGSQTAFYRIRYSYVCNEENPTFYSQDGVLYYKSNDQKAEFKY